MPAIRLAGIGRVSEFRCRGFLVHRRRVGVQWIAPLDQSVEIRALLGHSLLTAPSSVALGWDGLAVERRIIQAGEKPGTFNSAARPAPMGHPSRCG
jgi:hypothetical protein